MAAFMHEVELEMGMQSHRGRDPRGIDRLRRLALEMESLERHDKVREPDTNF